MRGDHAWNTGETRVGCRIWVHHESSEEPTESYEAYDQDIFLEHFEVSLDQTVFM